MQGYCPGECGRRIAGRYACPTRGWDSRPNGASLFCETTVLPPSSATVAACGGTMRGASTVPSCGASGAHRASQGRTGGRTAAGSTGSAVLAPVPSALSARRRSINRFPLLRRMTAVRPVSLRATTLCRILRETFLGVIPSLPAGSMSCANSVGVPINVARFLSKAERRKTILPPKSYGCW